MGTAIVAIPEEQDPVWQVSSEKIPHLTILFLGETSDHDNELIAQFVQHVNDTMLRRFYLDVDRRGTLGDEDADVLFFKKGWHTRDVQLARAAMLKNDTIKKAYDSTPQFEGWTPHLTLGYPSAPAKKDKDRIHDRFYGVSFDRLAVWFGDFDGPEFTLRDHDYGEDVAMSDLALAEHEATVLIGQEFVGNVLRHYGVKGMRWGVRRDRRTGEVVVTSARTGNKTIAKYDPKKLKVEEGSEGNVRVSGDRKAVREFRKEHERATKELDKMDSVSTEYKKLVVAKSKPTAALTNAELREAAERLELEQRYKSALQKSLPPKQLTGGDKAKKFVTDLLVDIGNNEVRRLAKGAAQIVVENKTVTDPKLKVSGDAFRDELGKRIKPKKK